MQRSGVRSPRRPPNRLFFELGIRESAAREVAPLVAEFRHRETQGSGLLRQPERFREVALRTHRYCGPTKRRCATPHRPKPSLRGGATEPGGPASSSLGSVRRVDKVCYSAATGDSFYCRLPSDPSSRRLCFGATSSPWPPGYYGESRPISS